MDWTTGSAYIKSSSLLVVLVEYMYHSLYTKKCIILTMSLQMNIIKKIQYIKIVELVLIVLQN